MAPKIRPMNRMRENLSAEFKACVAKEALREEQSVQDIAQKNEIALSQVSASKKELKERMSELSERKNGVNEPARCEEKCAGPASCLM